MRHLIKYQDAIEAINAASGGQPDLALDAALMFNIVPAVRLVDQDVVDKAVAYAAEQATRVAETLADWDAAAAKPRRKGSSDLRPSAVTVAQTLMDLAVGDTVTATNSGIAAAAGLGQPLHNNVSVARALRAFEQRGLIDRYYDAKNRERFIVIAQPHEFVDRVKALV